jgi:hypothetical protein
MPIEGEGRNGSMGDNDMADVEYRYKAMADVEYRYTAAFPKDPLPMMHWHRGYAGELARLMEQAIKDGRPLTPDDLLRAQGMAPAPPGAVV